MTWLTIEILFVLSALVLVYTFIGYNVLMAVIGYIRKPIKRQKPDSQPTVTAVLAMGNEEINAVTRLENLLASTYEALDVVVVLDSPSDKTADVIETFLAGCPDEDKQRVNVYPLETKSGKAACINHGISKAHGDVIVFCDARQTFEPDAVSHLVAHFGYPKVGAVSGELMIQGASEGDMGAYWRMEKALRKHESNASSVIGCTGAIYACRKELIDTIPHDTILDDVLIPMRCLEQGYTVKFEPKAIAYDPQPSTADSETWRKIRTLAGNWQLLFRYPGWLLPWKKTRPLMLVSHKYLRLLGPYLLAITFISNIALASYCSVFQGILLGQGVFYAFAILGMLLPATKNRLLTLSSTFVYLNWLNASALLYYLRGDYRRGWERKGE